MKLNEIRLGNWINQCVPNDMLEDELEEAPIDSDDLEWLAGDEESMEKSQPIPLTEDWLKKLGFEISNRLDNAWTDKNVGFPIWWNDETNSAYHINSETLVHLDYVHQLQNVFFALTGEELTITK